MLLVTVEVSIAADQAKSFQQNCSSFLKTVTEAPGCQNFHLAQTQEQATFVFYEQWESE